MIYNFLTVCVGPKYGPEYPNTVYRMVKRHFKEPFRFFCLTDRTQGLAPRIEVIRPTIDIPGWWNKLFMFSPLMPEGRLIYIDLDVTIVNDFTHPVATYTGQYCGDEDHIHFGKAIFGGDKHPPFTRIDCSLGTALVSMEAHFNSHPWDYYLENRAQVEKVFERHGDQVFTSWALRGKFDLWEKLYPQDHGFCSYRFDIVRKGWNPGDMKFINHHGNSKPHAVKDLPENGWLREAWHDRPLSLSRF